MTLYFRLRIAAIYLHLLLWMGCSRPARLEIIMAWVSSLDVIRELKEQRKRDREAQREQDKLNRELTKKARVSVARKIALFDAKTLSQMEAATLLDCVISQWQKSE
jgi:hypothetical protein